MNHINPDYIVTVGPVTGWDTYKAEREQSVLEVDVLETRKIGTFKDLRDKGYIVMVQVRAFQTPQVCSEFAVQ